jgi:glycopeptide antibiotics resistance protein
LFGVFIAVLLLIVYGSFYPWHFSARELTESPLYLLLNSWEITGGRRFIADVIVNITIYIPFGMTGYLALRSRVAPVVLALLVSGGVEMTQLFIPGRVCSSFDLLDNTIGAAIGVLVGLMFQRMAGPIQLRRPRDGDQAALAMLFVWVAAMLFPFYPSASMRAWRSKFMHFAHGPVASPVAILTAAVTWFTLVLMIRALRLRHPGRWMALSLLPIFGQIFVVTRQPTPALLLGAVLGLALGAAIGDVKVGVGLSVVALLVRGFVPFHFSSDAQPFIWTPFGGSLGMEWQPALGIVLDKIFYYGGAIWLLWRAGMPWLSSMTVICLLLAAIEAAQTHIMAHTAEVTDPLLALLVGLALRATQIQGRRERVDYPY